MKQSEIEKDKTIELIESHFMKGTQFLFEGAYYNPKWGCDMLQHLSEDIEALIATERRKAVEEFARFASVKGFVDGEEDHLVFDDLVRTYLKESEGKDG